jgi:hypothetical protein
MAVRVGWGSSVGVSDMVREAPGVTPLPGRGNGTGDLARCPAASGGHNVVLGWEDAI